MLNGGFTMENNTKPKHKGKMGHKVKIAFQFTILLTLILILSGILYFYVKYGKTILEMQTQARQMVDESTADTFKASQTSLVYDADGNLISTLKSEKDVYYINYEDIPTAAIDAMLTTEDRNFFEHKGVDYLANVRAAITLIKHKGHITQGASTITQQLARGVFLTQEVTYTRKIKEIFVAQELEKLYNKDQIMEFYLNTIYFANGHYGLQAASRAYFDKGVSELSLSQIAFLCSIPNNPSLYNPLTKMNNTLKRRDRVLKQMYDNQTISKEEYDKAIAETITLSKSKPDRQNYVETYTNYCAIRALMQQRGFVFRNEFDNDQDKKTYEKNYDELYSSFQKALYTNGYRIYTSFDLKKQELLQKSVDDSLDKFTDKDKNGTYKLQGAAVCIDNDTGRVVAIVGGRNQDLGGYTLNRAFQSYRQPGSSIKPLVVYTPSFERNYTPESIVVDQYIEGGPGKPNGHYYGQMKLQTALEKSLNSVAWQLFKELTPSVGLSYLKAMNFAKIDDNDYGLASALGGLTYGASPVEMASAYSTLENDGYFRDPTCIVKITDSDGNQIVGDDIKLKEIYDTNAARTMTEALTGVIKRGTASGKGLRYTISAGKTGTTNGTKDGWFVGYTPYYTTSVWVGYDIPKPVTGLMGRTYPLQIWHDYMDEIHTRDMTKSFEYYDWRAGLVQNLPSVTPTIAPTITQPPQGTVPGTTDPAVQVTPTPIPTPIPTTAPVVPAGTATNPGNGTPGGPNANTQVAPPVQ
jgi:Membrane carboxypeptidase (penicillin-binding protein)